MPDQPAANCPVCGRLSCGCTAPPGVTVITVGPSYFAAFNDTWTIGPGGTTEQWPPSETVTK